MDIIVKDVNYGDTTTIRVHSDQPNRRIIEVKVTEYHRDLTPVPIDDATLASLKDTAAQP